jgi:hypothetical protein
VRIKTYDAKIWNDFTEIMLIPVTASAESEWLKEIAYQLARLNEQIERSAKPLNQNVSKNLYNSSEG